MSFQRKVVPKGPSLRGVQPSHYTGQLVTSSGVGDLDRLFGGGLQIGTLALIIEDRGGGYAKLLLKYFLSEGLVHDQSLLVASSSNLVESLPSWEETEKGCKPEENKGSDDQMVIAWRYQGQQSTKEGNVASREEGHTFNMLKNIPKESLEKKDITTLNLDSFTHDLHLEDGWQNSSYCRLLQEIRRILQSGGYSVDSNSKTTHRPTKLIRLGLHSLGSLCLGGSLNHLTTFLLSLRSLLRNSAATACLTIPQHLMAEENNIAKLELCSDYLVQLDSFDGSEEVSTAYKDYHGLLNLHKVSSVGSLGPPVHLSQQQGQLVFKSKRSKFCVETFSLPPDLSETVSRDSSAQNKLKNIDF